MASKRDQTPTFKREDFLDNKYTRWYFKFCDRSDKSWRVVFDRDRHHIIPKCLGGGNQTENLAVVSIRQHFILHRMLVKMTTGTANNKMLAALASMGFGRKGEITAKQFEKATQAAREAGKSRPGHMKGKKHRRETVLKIKRSLKTAYKEGRRKVTVDAFVVAGAAARIGKPLSLEHRAVISKKNKGHPEIIAAAKRPKNYSEAYSVNQRNRMLGNQYAKGMKHSEESKQKMRGPRLKSKLANYRRWQPGGDFYEKFKRVV